MCILFTDKVDLGTFGWGRTSSYGNITRFFIYFLFRIFIMLRTIRDETSSLFLFSPFSLLCKRLSRIDFFSVIPASDFLSLFVFFACLLQCPSQSCRVLPLGTLTTVKWPLSSIR